MKIGFIIPARLKSERLPKKILLRLKGKTILEWTIERAKMIDYIDEVVVATTNLKSDSEITKICIENNVRYYQGDPDDVLKRIKDTMEFFDFDYALNITPDNPLFSYYLGNILADIIKNSNQNYDFLKFDNVPLGTMIYGLNRNCVRTICEFKDIIDTEVWGPLIKEEYFNVLKIKAPDMFDREYRLTLDTFQDFEMIRKIFNSIQKENKKPVDFSTVIDFLDKNKTIADINKNIIQKPVNPELLKKVDELFQDNFNEFLELKKKYYEERG
ncbi:cytidylyltransferase domain-containing protein [Petrotoga sp. Shatin.DS.tank11.9.2.9.3]|uniref:cytidylyltransferase domain-containing protein n=1 Tax=Petrotoga sp. Shatin.DS.tank11.9.2.9.3 TaxID=1469556 RepID=UPI000FF525AC|nr:3-deoxy-manno-octulosonate cytidylyltransferase [Petrotoga sp. Shatin.DS.tank11.9.2.9.3]RLL85239.1 hypothetical protein BZ25_02670 [Petrotoga sp. Shatin.DS.tank11.9.2.9.3]